MLHERTSTYLWDGGSLFAACSEMSRFVQRWRESKQSVSSDVPLASNLPGVQMRCFQVAATWAYQIRARPFFVAYIITFLWTDNKRRWGNGNVLEDLCVKAASLDSQPIPFNTGLHGDSLIRKNQMEGAPISHQALMSALKRQCVQSSFSSRWTSTVFLRYEFNRRTLLHGLDLNPNCLEKKNNIKGTLGLALCCFNVPFNFFFFFWE